MVYPISFLYVGITNNKNNNISCHDAMDLIAKNNVLTIEENSSTPYFKLILSSGKEEYLLIYTPNNEPDHPLYSKYNSNEPKRIDSLPQEDRRLILYGSLSNNALTIYILSV